MEKLKAKGISFYTRKEVFGNVSSIGKNGKVSGIYKDGEHVALVGGTGKLHCGMHDLYVGDKVLYNGIECEVVFYMACFCLEFKAGLGEIKRIPLFEIKFDLLKNK